jgi:hypothetical protein
MEVTPVGNHDQLRSLQLNVHPRLPSGSLLAAGEGDARTARQRRPQRALAPKARLSQ